MYKISLIDKITIILVIIGALNWGLIGISNLNLVTLIASLLGSMAATFERIIYIIVGLSAINVLFIFFKGKYQKYT